MSFPQPRRPLALSLDPVRGQRAPLDGDSWAWSFAPGRARVALVSDSPGPELRLIDLRSMRVIGDARLARRGSAWATAWVSPRRLLGVVVTRADDTIVAGVDAATRRVLWRRRLGGSLRVGEVFHNGLVLILGPRTDVGPSRLVRVSAGGAGARHAARLLLPRLRPPNARRRTDRLLASRREKVPQLR